MLSVFSRIHIDTKTKLSLFDSLAVSIILYSSEVWGIYTITEIDKLHLTFCKYVLGVRQTTSDVVVLGELGRFPLTVICKERALTYWTRIMKTPDSLIHRIVMGQRNLIDNIEVNNNISCRNLYCYSIKCLLDNTGFSLWLAQC